jgi:hypothetical protein
MNSDQRSTPSQCAVGVYESIEKAESAARALHRAGFTAGQVSLVKRHLDPAGETAARLSLGDDSVRDAAIGGALGSLAGLAGAATLISVTGVGLILLTGPLVTLTGAIVGAFLGALSGWGVHETNIRRYESLVEAGKVLVVVAGQPTEVEKAEALLRDSQASHVHLHAKASDDSPEVDDRQTSRSADK